MLEPLGLGVLGVLGVGSSLVGVLDTTESSVPPSVAAPVKAPEHATRSSALERARRRRRRVACGEPIPSGYRLPARLDTLPEHFPLRSAG